MDAIPLTPARQEPAPVTGEHAIVAFTTESGSRYELDTVCRQVRRISGGHSPTARQGRDGAWRPYVAVTAPVIPGEQVIICWLYNPETSAFKGTQTSIVTSVKVINGHCAQV